MAEEKNYENKVKAYLAEQGCYTIKYHGDRFSAVGVPDLLVCHKGRFIGLEMKATNGKPSELQLLNLRNINNAGGLGGIVIPTAGKRAVALYIKNKFPQYLPINIWDISDLKKVIENY